MFGGNGRRGGKIFGAVVWYRSQLTVHRSRAGSEEPGSIVAHHPFAKDEKMIKPNYAAFRGEISLRNFFSLRTPIDRDRVA